MLGRQASLSETVLGSCPKGSEQTSEYPRPSVRSYQRSSYSMSWIVRPRASRKTIPINEDNHCFRDNDTPFNRWAVPLSRYKKHNSAFGTGSL